MPIDRSRDMRGDARRAVPWVPLAWTALGVAIAVGSWRMDRLEQMHINPYSAPGIVPGVLGVLMALFGAVLAWRSRGGEPAGDVGGGERAPDGASGGMPAAGSAHDLPYPVATSAALCIAFAVGLLGRGLPFTATSAAFMFVFIVAFSHRAWPRGRRLRGIASAAAIAIVGSSLVAWLFSEVFLVRLP